MPDDLAALSNARLKELWNRWDDLATKAAAKGERLENSGDSAQAAEWYGKSEAYQNCAAELAAIVGAEAGR